MFKSFIQLIVGDLEDKRIYRQFKKRVNALPKDYRFAFKKIQHYLYYVDISGCDMSLFTDLVELFEDSAAHGKSVVEIVGNDVAAFCDELVLASSIKNPTTREKLNKEILDYFNKEVK